MMRNLFMVLSLLMDSQVVAETVEFSFTLAIIGVGVLFLLGSWHAAQRLARSRV